VPILTACELVSVVEHPAESILLSVETSSLVLPRASASLALLQRVTQCSARMVSGSGLCLIHVLNVEDGMRRVWFHPCVYLLIGSLVGVCGGASAVRAAEDEAQPVIRGTVQNQDLRRVGQAVVEVKNQEGGLVATTVSNDAGEFSVSVPASGTYSVSAVQETYRSEYVVLILGGDPPKPVNLTLSLTKDIALEVVSPLPPIQYKASSETYSVSRKDIEALPRGNNNDLHDILLTIPGAVYGSLKQVHIRQDHANLQLRIDGVPIPETVSSTFSDVISPRAWERADIVLGGMES